MCGITGYVLSTRVEDSIEPIRSMNEMVSHRGPDDEGITVFQPEEFSAVDLVVPSRSNQLNNCVRIDSSKAYPHRIAFGHCRFSIIDVTPAGHQPFWSSDQSVCVSFNGEIYNYLELRDELRGKGHTFRTRSDTEVLVEAYREWGVDCFKKFNGFWALSLYDSQRGEVLLARDRIGKAPLYIYQNSKGVWWASEIKALLRFLNVGPEEVRSQAVFDYVVHGWRDVFHKTFYKEVYTFPNGAYAWVGSDGRLEARKFWGVPRSRLRERDIAIHEAVSTVDSILEDAVKIRLRADVPVGFELSGGLDSSSLVSYAARSGQRMHVFNVSFPGTAADEEMFARKVVERYPEHVDYQVLTPPEEDFFERADAYFWLLEEPFHSPNLLTNQSLWRRMAGQGIRVSINGAGGDEVFAGYPGYYYFPFLFSLLRQGKPIRFLREFFLYSEHIPGHVGLDYLRRGFHFIRESLRGLRKMMPRVPETSDPFIAPRDVEDLRGPSWDIEQRLRDNIGDWLMNYWMRSGNKSSMEVPLEVRMPFLDYRLVEFAFTLPVGYLIRNGWHKWILREAVKDHLPNDVVWRKEKFGFPFPYREWFSASKRRFLTSVRDTDCPYVDGKRLERHYDELSRTNPIYLWRLFCVILWWKKWIKKESLVFI